MKTGSYFEEMTEKLTERIVAAVQDLGRSEGLPTFAAEGLAQMSVKIPDIAQELLMFGFNVWPDDLESEECGSPPLAEPERASVAA